MPCCEDPASISTKVVSEGIAAFICILPLSAETAHFGLLHVLCRGTEPARAVRSLEASLKFALVLASNLCRLTLRLVLLVGRRVFRFGSAEPLSTDRPGENPFRWKGFEVLHTIVQMAIADFDAAHWRGSGTADGGNRIGRSVLVGSPSGPE
jgi:hypothetical protein